MVNKGSTMQAASLKLDYNNNWLSKRLFGRPDLKKLIERV